MSQPIQVPNPPENTKELPIVFVKNISEPDYTKRTSRNFIGLHHAL